MGGHIPLSNVSESVETFYFSGDVSGKSLSIDRRNVLWIAARFSSGNLLNKPHVRKIKDDAFNDRVTQCFKDNELNDSCFGCYFTEVTVEIYEIISK